jgi:hypothetical protein
MGMTPAIRRCLGTRPARLALGGALLPLLLAGCGGSSPSTSAAHPVAITERDFHIQTPTHLQPGHVLLRVSNEGPDQHELIVLRRDPSAVPLRADGITVDEESLEGAEAGSLEPGEPGSVRYLSVDLKPGRYLFFCNMEGHFMGGMHSEVVVG